MFICLSSTIFAQLYCPPPHGKRSDGSFHISLGAGPTYLRGDIHKPNTVGRAAFFRLDYTILKGIDLGIEGQFGSLEALGDVTDPREVRNNYRGIGLVATFYPFKFFSAPRYTRPSLVELIGESLYVGVGIMGLVNNYDSIYRDMAMPSTWGPTAYVDPDDGPIFQTRTNSMTLPTANVGLAVPINKRRSTMGKYWSVLLNAQFNFANNDLVDGYTPYDAAGNPIDTAHDMYSFYTLGVRYSF